MLASCFSEETGWLNFSHIDRKMWCVACNTVGTVLSAAGSVCSVAGAACSAACTGYSAGGAVGSEVDTVCSVTGFSVQYSRCSVQCSR